MEKSRFLDLIKNYNNLSGMDRQILKNNILKYPYCTILHTLYAKSYYQGDTGNIEELNIAAAYAPNRGVLKRTIDGNLDLNSLDFFSNGTAIAETIPEPVVKKTEEVEVKDENLPATTVTEKLEELQESLPEAPAIPPLEKTSFWKKGIFGATLAAGAAAASKAASDSKEAISESVEKVAESVEIAKESTIDKVEALTTQEVEPESLPSTVFDRKVEEIKAQEAIADEVNLEPRRKTVLEQKIEALEAESNTEVETKTTSFFDESIDDTEVSTVVDSIAELPEAAIEESLAEAVVEEITEPIVEVSEPIVEAAALPVIEEVVAPEIEPIAEAPALVVDPEAIELPEEVVDEVIADTVVEEPISSDPELNSEVASSTAEQEINEDKSERISDLETSMAALKAKRLAFLNDDEDDEDDKIEAKVEDEPSTITSKGILGTVIGGAGVAAAAIFKDAEPEDAPDIAENVSDSEVENTLSIEEPIIEETVVKESVVEETPVMETPILEETPVVETPVIEEPLVETPIVETPNLEDIVAEDAVNTNIDQIIAEDPAPIVEEVPKLNVRDQIKALEENEVTEAETVVEATTTETDTFAQRLENVSSVEEEIVHEFSTEKIDTSSEDVESSEVFSEDLASQFKDVEAIPIVTDLGESEQLVEDLPVVEDQPIVKDLPVVEDLTKAEDIAFEEELPAAAKVFDRTSYREKQKAIIDKFMNETNVSKKILKNSSDETKANDPLPDLAAGSTTLPSDIYTETLAQLNLKQGNKEIALDIYEKLILKNPEKKAYFASKIQELKNL